MYTLSYIRQILGLETSAVQDQELVDIVIDSRAILEGKRSLFVAIKASHRTDMILLSRPMKKGYVVF